MFADIADQAVPCNNNSSSGCAALLQEVASMLGARRKREREREGEKKEARGGSRPRSRRRRGDAFKDTAALSLYNVNKEQDLKKTVPCGQGNCEGQSRSVGCASFWVGYFFHVSSPLICTKILLSSLQFLRGK